MSNADMATMPVRELIVAIRSHVSKLGPDQMISAMVLSVLCTRMTEQADDIDRLVCHGAILGHEWPDTGDLCEMKNESWRALPNHLRDLLNTEAERLENTDAN